MQVTINLTKKEIQHLKEGCYSELDSCETIIDIIEKIKKVIK